MQLEENYGKMSLQKSFNILIVVPATVCNVFLHEYDIWI